MLEIQFITDYVCPYCLVAKEAILQALEETGLQAHIQIHPMELTPITKERVDTYNDPVRRSHYQVLVEPTKELGLDMKLPPAIVPRPYTKYAFEGRFYAIEQGKEDAYNDLMYKAYFLEEQDIGDLDVLCDLVKRLDFDIAAFRKTLEDGIYEEKQMACNDYARNVLKPEGLPTIYVNGEKINIETYSKDEMIGILTNFESSPLQPAKDAENHDDLIQLISLNGDELDEEEDDVNPAPTFFGCGPDGC